MSRLLAAQEAALAAAAVIRVGQPRSVRSKGSEIDLVTEVDQAAERAVREVLERLSPGVPILGEEEGGSYARGDDAETWVVDPLDGTTNFVHGFPVYAVSIALVRGGVPQVGVVLDVPRDRLYFAERGRGAFCGAARLAVSGRSRPEHCLVATGFPYDRAQRASYYLRRVESVLRGVRGLRRAGAAALDLAWVAEGVFDAYWEFNLRPWDVAAGWLLVEEAGGRVTGLDGQPGLDPWWPCPLATNGRIHEWMVERLRVSEEEGTDPPG